VAVVTIIYFIDLGLITSLYWTLNLRTGNIRSTEKVRLFIVIFSCCQIWIFSELSRFATLLATSGGTQAHFELDATELFPSAPRILLLAIWHVSHDWMTITEQTRTQHYGPSVLALFCLCFHYNSPCKDKSFSIGPLHSLSSKARTTAQPNFIHQQTNDSK
jgi:hypothetical protein